MDAEAARNLATQKGDIQAVGQQAAYQNAQQQFNADQARRMQAQQANQGAGLTAGQANLQALLGVQQLGSGQDMQAQLANQQYGLQAQQLGEQSRQFGAGQGLQSASLGAQYGQAANQLNEQSNQYGAGLGMQGLQTALTGAGQLGALGGQQFQQGMDINKLQNAYGGQQQALRQQGLSQAYGDFQDEKNYPYKQLGFMSDMIRGLPLGQQTTKTMYEPNPGMAQQIGSLGMGAYGLSKFMADGGMAYADGGSVDSQDNISRIASKLSDQQLQQAAQAAQARGDQDQLEAIQSEMGMRASERNGLASAVTPQMADQMAGGGVVAFAQGGSSATLSQLGELADTDLTETPEQRTAGAQAALPGIQAMYGPSATAPYMEEIKKERAGLSKMSGEGEGLAFLAASQALLRPGSKSRAVAGAMGAFGTEIVKMKKEQREADRQLRQSELTLATADQARKDGQIGKAEGLYEKSQAQKEKGLDRQIGVLEKKAAIEAGRENAQTQAAATMAGVNKPTDLDKQAQAVYEAKVTKDPSIAIDAVKKAEAMAQARATAADQLGRYPGSARAEAATTKAMAPELENALLQSKAYRKAMNAGNYEEAAAIREQIVSSMKPADKKDNTAPAVAPQAAATAIKVTTEAQFAKLKPGTTFIAPDGSTRIKQ